MATDVEDGEVGQPGECEYFSMYTGGEKRSSFNTQGKFEAARSRDNSCQDGAREWCPVIKPTLSRH